MAKRKITPRKPPADDAFIAAGSDEDDDAPVASKPEGKKHKDKSKRKDKKKKSKSKPPTENYFGDDGDEDEGVSGEFASADEGQEAGDDDDDGDPLIGKSKLSNKIPKRQIVAYDDDRKLSKKAKTQLEVWKGKSRGKALDAFYRAHAARARQKTGHSSVFIGSEADALIVGIPMFGGYGPDAAKYPGCLGLEFLIAQDVFPLGLVWQIVAKYGVGKSGLLAEFARWFNLAGGGAEINENETKFNPHWYKSIMGEEFFGRMMLNRCTSVEDWQRNLSFSVADMKEFMIGSKEEPGPGRTFPALFGVDSIMGKLSEKSQEKILGAKGKSGKRGKTGEGAADRGYPVEALVITRYMRTIPGELDNWPFGLVLVNHLRINKDDSGNESRNKAGGEQVNFQESFEIELQKVGGHKKKIECAEWEGYPIALSCEKNSFGPTHRRIMTRLVWHEVEQADGNWKQETFWDWDWTTVHLLNNILRGEFASPKLRASLKATGFHLECPCTSDIENTAWSKNLDMKAKDVKSWREVGAMIRKDQNLMDLLRKALRINARPVLQGDYCQQLNALTDNLP
jgi:hypothetical protein